jgi:Tol biopolymer transport system component
MSPGPRTFDVTVFDTQTSTSQILTQTPESREWGFSVSPTASLAAFQLIDWDADTRYLYLLDLESGDLEILVETPDFGESVSPSGWSPDGRYLQFFYGGGGEGCYGPPAH